MDRHGELTRTEQRKARIRIMEEQTKIRKRFDERAEQRQASAVRKEKKSEAKWIPA